MDDESGALEIQPLAGEVGCNQSVDGAGAKGLDGFAADASRGQATAADAAQHVEDGVGRRCRPGKDQHRIGSGENEIAQHRELR